MRFPYWTLAILVTGLGTADAQRKPHPSFAPVEDDPALPRVLLIGDSISMGYTIPVREKLAGKANLHRIPVNGGPSSRGVENLDKWLGDGTWDVIHVNFGLHDVRYMDDGTRQVSPEDYRANLGAIFDRLAETGATLIWCSTTPVPAGELTPVRKNEDVLEYNRIAAEVMAAREVPVNDLYAFALPKLAEIQIAANVHFTAEGYGVLAEKVAADIAGALPAQE